MDNTQKISGDLAVGRCASIAENAHVRGSLIIGQNLTVSGWLDAPHLRTPALGLFPTVQALSQAYPRPRAGWWALVGDTLPADIYIAEDGQWVGTGHQGGQPTLDCQRFESALAQTNDDLVQATATIQSLSAQIASIQSSLQSLESASASHQSSIQSLESASASYQSSIQSLESTCCNLELLCQGNDAAISQLNQTVNDLDTRVVDLYDILNP